MTGTLSISSSNIDTSIIPSSGVTGRAIIFNDKNHQSIASFYPGRNTSGTNSFVCASYQQVNGTNKTNYMMLGTESNGNATVQFSHPAAWRTALGIESYTRTMSAATFTESLSGTNTHIFLKNHNVIVFFQGENKTHAVGDVLFTFNSGYRPAYTLVVPFTSSSTAYGGLQVNSAGVASILYITNGTSSGRILAYFSFPLT